jgi:hypothetical protein
VKPCPFPDELHSARFQAARQQSSVNRHRGTSASVVGVKVSYRVIFLIPVHVDHYVIERADTRHGSDASGALHPLPAAGRASRDQRPEMWRARSQSGVFAAGPILADVGWPRTTKRGEPPERTGPYGCNLRTVNSHEFPSAEGGTVGRVRVSASVATRAAQSRRLDGERHKQEGVTVARRRRRGRYIPA